MSGIFSVLRFGGAPVLKTELIAMAEPMRRRGPEGVVVWSGDSIGMGHTLLATTSEAAIEKLPMNHAASGLTITADARLDNRETLIDQLDLTDRKVPVGDGELILRSYLKWDKDCVNYLLGDFAFSIWNQRQRTMFCARDHLGMKQLLYTHREGKLFACATDHEAVLALEDVPRQINQARILDCLTDHLESVDKTSTMFSNISRLPPGHIIEVRSGLIDVQTYWKMQPPEELHLKDDQEYQDAFKEVFDEAVRARLRGGSIVGSMMSGGLDSGSVVASACEIRKSQSFGALQTISGVDHIASGSNPETQAIFAMSKLDGIQPHFVNLQDMTELTPSILQSLPDMREPFDGSMNLIRGVYHTANTKGLKVILDGVGGDAALEIGNYGKRLIRRGHLIKAWREMKADHQFWGLDASDWETYLRMLVSTLMPAALRSWRGKMATKRLAKDMISDAGISREFADKCNLNNRLEKFRAYGSLSTWNNPQQHAVRVVEHPNEVVARERYDRVAAEYGIETRDPFRDLRVVNFCASLPSSQKSKNGLAKYILRQAFADSFPAEIKGRMGKEDLGWAFTHRVLEHAKTHPKFQQSGLNSILEPYYSAASEIDVFSEDWFYVANWLVGQNNRLQAQAA